MTAGTLVFTASPASAGNSQGGQPTILINPGGGALATSTDGLKMQINGPSGYDQFWYVGTYQYCCSAGAPMLNIGGTLFGEASAARSSSSWSSLQILSTTGSATTTGGSATGSGSATVRYTASKGGRSYTMDRHVQYTFPNDYVTETYSFQIPTGNTDTVKFYLGGDTAPGSSDQGYGVMLTSPVRSVISLNTSSRIQFGFREVAGSKSFDGATSQHYNTPYPAVQSGGDIGFVTTASNHDAGLMVQWNLDSTPGTQTASLQTFTNKQGTSLTAAFREGTIELGDPGLLDLSVVNTQLSSTSGIGYTFALPTGLTVGASSSGNGCGGTLSAVSGSSTITLSGASIAATTNCVVSVPLVTAGAGAYRINAASVTATTNIENGVGGATLTVNGPQIAALWQDQTIAAPSLGTPYTDGVSATGSPAPTYTISAGSLPAGLSIDDLTGAITGTPSASGAYNFTITATNGVGSNLVKQFTGSVFTPVAPSWTDQTVARAVAGETYADGVMASGAPTPTYSISAGALPTGLTLDSGTGAITGTPTDAAGSAYTFTVRASNGVGTAVTKTFSNTIAAAPAWTDSTIGVPVLGAAFTDGLSASGTPAPTYAISAGTIPTGLSLNTTTGAITGTPTVAGPFDFTVAASNGIGSPIQRQLSGEVRQAPQWTDSTIGAIRAGQNVADGVAAIGTPTPTYTVTAGALPTGLTLNSVSGEIAGIPATNGAYDFTISASNGTGTAATQRFTGTVLEAFVSPGWIESVLGIPSVGQSYTDGVAASGNPAPTFSITLGSLPSGLTLDTANGSVTGTPTAAGAYSFTMSAANGIGVPATLQFSGTVTESTAWVDGTIGGLQVGAPFNDRVEASGTPAPSYAVTSGVLPHGLSINNATGAITGTPSAAGEFDFTVTAANGIGAPVTKQFSGTVTQDVTWGDTTMGEVRVNLPFEAAMAAFGTPAPTYSVSAGALPDGLTLDTRTGAITGTPTTAGPYDFTITATNGVGQPASQRFSGSTLPAFASPSWVDRSLATPIIGASYDDGVRATGNPVPTYSVSAGVLPDGVTLDSQTGAITGTPTKAGNYRFTITATNGQGTPISLKFAGEISAPPIVPVPPIVPAPPTVPGSETPAQIELLLELEIGAQVGTAGSGITITGEGLLPGSEFSVTMRSEPRVLLVGIVGTDGKFTRRLMLPSDTPPGKHSLTLNAIDANGSPISDVDYFMISADGRIQAMPDNKAPETQTVRAPKSLAFTGRSSFPLIALGAVLAMVGTALLERKRFLEMLRRKANPVTS